MKFSILSAGMQEHSFLSLFMLCLFPVSVILIESWKSHQINRHFHFWKFFRGVHMKKPKIKLNNEEKENSTLIGYNHRKPIYIPDNCKHVFICGTTGSGKTVALSNFVYHAVKGNMPLLVVDGKGDVGNGSLLKICQNFCGQYDKKLYVVNLSHPQSSDTYNPFKNASPTACKDMLVNITDWSEEHYKSNTERYLQRLAICLSQAGILMSFNTLIKYIDCEEFQMLSANLLKDKIISKTEHLLNLDIIKTCGKIAENAAARFLTIAESETGTIFSDNGIDIYTAIRENALILFVLNPLLYPELTPSFGRLILIDAKQAVSKCFNTNLKRAFFVLDEINTYASPVLTDLVNKSRSANITAILATQSLSDLDFAVNENFKEQIIENCNNYIVMRQNSAKNAEQWANILGTKATIDVTYQLEQQHRITSATGLGSARRVREFLYHPDDIKSLQTGKGVFLSRDYSTHCRIEIYKPF